MPRYDHRCVAQDCRLPISEVFSFSRHCQVASFSILEILEYCVYCPVQYSGSTSQYLHHESFPNLIGQTG